MRARRALVRVAVGAVRVQRDADESGPCQQRQRGPWRLGGPIRVGEAVMATRAADMLAQQVPVEGQQPHDAVGPLHLDALADPAGRRRVVRGLDLDAAIEMDVRVPYR